MKRGAIVKAWYVVINLVLGLLTGGCSGPDTSSNSATATAIEKTASNQRTPTECPPLMVTGNNPFEPKYSTTDYLRIIGPNGGEVYKIGDKITVKWKNCNYPEDMGINISLIDSRVQQGDFEIARRIPINSGSYSFAIPATIFTYGTTFNIGGDNVYTIFISTGMVGGGSGSVSASNAPFTINAKSDAK